MVDSDSALAAWRDILGPAHVITDESSLAAVETATFATDRRVPAIIRPGDRAEVKECVRIANRYRTPLYPVSAGKNWGYGSRVPVRDGCVVMELGRLDRIIDFDATLAYVTVEPGVTFGQLHRFPARAARWRRRNLECRNGAGCAAAGHRSGNHPCALDRRSSAGISHRYASLIAAGIARL